MYISEHLRKWVLLAYWSYTEIKVVFKTSLKDLSAYGSLSRPAGRLCQFKEPHFPIFLCFRFAGNLDGGFRKKRESFWLFKLGRVLIGPQGLQCPANRYSSAAIWAQMLYTSLMEGNTGDTGTVQGMLLIHFTFYEVVLQILVHRQ